MIRFLCLFAFTLVSSVSLAGAPAKNSTCDLKLIDLPGLRAHMQELTLELTENERDLEKRLRLQSAANEVVARTSFSDRDALAAFTFLRTLKSRDPDAKLSPVRVTPEPVQIQMHNVSERDEVSGDVHGCKTVTYAVETVEEIPKRIAYVTFVMVTPTAGSQVNWERDFQSRTFEPPATEFASSDDRRRFVTAVEAVKGQTSKLRREVMSTHIPPRSKLRVYFATIVSRVDSTRIGLSQGNFLNTGEDFLSFLKGHEI